MRCVLQNAADGFEPSGMLVKAMLIAGAQPLVGLNGTHPYSPERHKMKEENLICIR